METILTWVTAMTGEWGAFSWPCTSPGHQVPGRGRPPSTVRHLGSLPNTHSLRAWLAKMVLRTPSRPSCPRLAIVTEGDPGCWCWGAWAWACPYPPGQEQEGAKPSRQGTALCGRPLETPGMETGPGPHSSYSKARKLRLSIQSIPPLFKSSLDET